jgi:hypothetical protein
MAQPVWPAPRLMDPRLLRQKVQQNAQPALPVSLRMGQVSQILQRNDQYQATLPRQNAPVPLLRPLFSYGSISRIAAPQLSQRLQQSVQFGLAEWGKGVRESSTNSSPRIDTYARNADFSPGYEWCGFFTGFAHSQAGFKYPESYASYQKARDFFMYRSYTNHSSSKNKELDGLRLQHQTQGSTRQYYMLSESNNHAYLRENPSLFKHFQEAENTFQWQNLPIQPGDVALFNHGHVGLVVSYNAQTGHLVTVEGNTSGQGPDGKKWSQAVVRKEYNLSQVADRSRFDGFGRPALGDFN